MAKQDVYWFRHDGNAHRDVKILEMRLIYGSEGYGWWWILLELMREATDYKLRYSGKHDLKMLAKQLDTSADKLKQFIEDCTEDFNLFEKDDTYFWSPSMLRRMENYDEICEKRRIAGSKSHKND